MIKSAAPALISLVALGALAQVPAQGPPGQGHDGPSPDQLTKLAAVIKPRPDETRWQQIPWVTDVNEGLRQARAEKRPLLLWTILGDPLDEC
jgi:hypothetical protein